MRGSSLGSSRSRENCIETPRCISKRNFFWQANYAIQRILLWVKKISCIALFSLREIAYRYDWVEESKAGRSVSKNGKRRIARGIGRTTVNGWYYLNLIRYRGNSVLSHEYDQILYTTIFVRILFSVYRKDILYPDYIDQQSLY